MYSSCLILMAFSIILFFLILRNVSSFQRLEPSSLVFWKSLKPFTPPNRTGNTQHLSNLILSREIETLFSSTTLFTFLVYYFGECLGDEFEQVYHSILVTRCCTQFLRYGNIGRLKPVHRQLAVILYVIKETVRYPESS